MPTISLRSVMMYVVLNSFWRILKLLSEPLRKAVQCFRTSGSTGRVFRLRGSSTKKNLCDVVLPVSKSDGTRSSLQIRGCVKYSYHISRRPHLLVRGSGWVGLSPIARQSAAKAVLSSVRPMCSALFDIVTDSVCSAGHNSRANHSVPGNMQFDQQESKPRKETTSQARLHFFIKAAQNTSISCLLAGKQLGQKWLASRL